MANSPVPAIGSASKSTSKLAIAADAALRLSAQALGRLVVNEACMAANLEASGCLILAEAASFALAEHLPRPEAQTLVKAAAPRRPGTAANSWACWPR